MQPITRAHPPVRGQRSNAPVTLSAIAVVAAAFLWTLRMNFASPIPAWGCILLIVFAVVVTGRVSEGHFKITPFTVPLLLYVLSAGLGLWTTHELAATSRHLVSVLIALGLYWTLARIVDERSTEIVLSGLAALATALALYALVDRSLFTPQQNTIGGMNENDVGGLLALALPLQIALMMRWRHAAPALYWPGKAGVLILLTGILLSHSRGALISTVVTLSLWGVWRAYKNGRFVELKAFRSVRKRREHRYVWITGTALGALLLLLVWVVAASAGLAAPDIVRRQLQSRLDIAPSALRLARDYPFTGTGMGTFEMQYAAYTLLIHVGYIPHAHNLLLDILIEQGLLGLSAYLWLVSLTFVWGIRQLWRSLRSTWFIEAALAMQVVILLHGLVDDVLYLNRGLLLIPMGLIAGALQCCRWSNSPTTETEGKRQRGRAVREVALGALAFTLIVWWPVLYGAWWANLGAVAQSRLELALYDQARFSELTLDEIRRENTQAHAQAYFDRALAANPENVTARQRRAGIALARGAYDKAQADMQAAWEAGHRDPTTRLLLGDSLVATGDAARAAQVIEGLPWAETRLRLQAWSRYWTRDQLPQAHCAWETLRTLDPDDREAERWLARIERQMAPETLPATSTEE